MQTHYVMTVLNFPVLFSNQEFKSTSTDLISKALAIELRKVTSLKIFNDNYSILFLHVYSNCETVNKTPR